MAGKQRAVQSGNFRPESPVGASSWRLNGQELNPRDLLLGAGPLIGKHAQPPPAGLQALQFSEARLRSPLRAQCISTGKEGEVLKVRFLNFYQTL